MVRCFRCGRELTAPESVQRGIGPVCITKIQRAYAAQVAQEEPDWGHLGGAIFGRIAHLLERLGIVDEAAQDMARLGAAIEMKEKYAAHGAVYALLSRVWTIDGDRREELVSLYDYQHFTNAYELLKDLGTADWVKKKSRKDHAAFQQRRAVWEKYQAQRERQRERQEVVRQARQRVRRLRGVTPRSTCYHSRRRLTTRRQVQAGQLPLPLDEEGQEPVAAQEGLLMVAGG